MDLWLFIVTLQSITVNSTSPCFLNYSAAYQMWQNCGMGKDYLQTALLPWQWVTGGYFSMILAAVFSIMTYIKYQKAVYPMAIGTIFLPISYFVFPNVFLVWAMVMSGLLIGILIWWAFLSQTNET